MDFSEMFNEEFLVWMFNEDSMVKTISPSTLMYNRRMGKLEWHIKGRMLKWLQMNRHISSELYKTGESIMCGSITLWTPEKKE